MQCANWKTMFHYGMPLFCMKHITLQKLQNQIKVAQTSSFLKHWVSELYNSISNRKQKTVTNPTEHTGCPRRNGQNFGRVFLMLKYTDITQNTYVQS